MIAKKLCEHFYSFIYMGEHLLQLRTKPMKQNEAMVTVCLFVFPSVLFFPGGVRRWVGASRPTKITNQNFDFAAARPPALTRARKHVHMHARIHTQKHTQDPINTCVPTVCIASLSICNMKTCPHTIHSSHWTVYTLVV